MKDKQYTLEELKESLNDQQKVFCEAKLFNNNVQAYLIAYPNCEYKSASASATRLLEDARIVQYIAFLKNNIEDITGVSKIRNVAELAKIAYSSIAHLHDTWIDKKKFDNLAKDNPGILDCIQSIESSKEMRNIGGASASNQNIIEVEVVKIRLYSKLTAIEQINKMMGYNEAEKHDHTTKGESINKITSIEVIHSNEHSSK